MVSVEVDRMVVESEVERLVMGCKGDLHCDDDSPLRNEEPHSDEAICDPRDMLEVDNWPEPSESLKLCELLPRTEAFKGLPRPSCGRYKEGCGWGYEYDRCSTSEEKGTVGLTRTHQMLPADHWRPTHISGAAAAWRAAAELGTTISSESLGNLPQRNQSIHLWSRAFGGT